MQKHAGITFSMSNLDILTIDSPSTKVDGPWIVVYKDTANRWAIVALDWEGKPRLGIRWFYGNSGTPISSSYATWFILPDDLIPSIISGLVGLYVSAHVCNEVQQYVQGKITGPELREHLQN